MPFPSSDDFQRAKRAEKQPSKAFCFSATGLSAHEQRALRCRGGGASSQPGWREALEKDETSWGQRDGGRERWALGTGWCSPFQLS